MQVVFGWDLDGGGYPETVLDGASSLNSAVLGPMGLLGLLETRLGLRRPSEPRAVRVAQYLAALHKVSESKRFFSNSLRLDPWATADRLLQGRDELIAAGWDKQPIADFEKIEALAAVEEHAKVGMGFGERLQEVAKALEDFGKSPINRMRLIGRFEFLPLPLQNLVVLLQRLGMEREATEVFERESFSDLAILQARIFGTGGQNLSELQMRGDGSLTVIDAEDELQAAELVAGWFRAKTNLEEVVIIRGEDSSALNQACQRFALPQIGNTVRSEFRSILQVLPFAFEMAWRPIDPKRLAEFLTLDGGPIPYMVAKNLLDAVAEQPGIGGPMWTEAWNKILKSEVEAALSSDATKSRNDAEHEGKERVDKLKAWFDTAVPSANASISLEDGLKVCKRVGQWAGMRAQFAPKHRLYDIAKQHSILLSQLLRECGLSAIPPTQLRKMIGAVTGYGVTSSSAELAEWTCLDRPGQIWNRAPTVVWWQFAQPTAQGVRLSVWSPMEIERLNAHGISIDTPLQRLRRESESWRAPFLFSTEHLVLVKPRMCSGRDAIPHPIWDEICSLIEEKQLQRVTVQASQLFVMRKKDGPWLEVSVEPKSLRKLPGLKRNWELPAGVVAPRERNESFSSIDKLLGCSLAWVLEYKGFMRQPKALDLSKNDLLIGKLAHAVVDAIYTEKKRWRPEEARVRAEQYLTEFIPQRAASLLLPGAGPQLRQASEAIPSAVEHLTQVLNDANLRVDETEFPLEAKFNEKRGLGGTADMLAYTAENVPVILDFKWSASPLWHRKKIAKGQALQLAVYAYLALHLKGATGEIPAGDWPPVGYFMLRGKEMYFTKDDVFPANSHVRKQDRSLKDTFEVMVAEYERELAAVQNGQLTAYGVDPDNARIEDFMRQLLNEPPCKFCNLHYICGRREVQ